MEDKSIGDLSFLSGECISNGVTDKRCDYFCTQPICNNVSAAQIHNGAEIVCSQRRDDVGNIRYPAVINLLLNELPIQQVFIAVTTLLIQCIVPPADSSGQWRRS